MFIYMYVKIFTCINTPIYVYLYEYVGTITAANSSKLNDGSAAMVIVSGKFCKKFNLMPLFRILGFGDAAKDPVEFTTAPSDVIPYLLMILLTNLSFSLTDVTLSKLIT